MGSTGLHGPALVNHQQGFGEGGQAGAAKTLMTTSAGEMPGMLGTEAVRRQATRAARTRHHWPIVSGNSTLWRGLSSSRCAPAAAGPPGTVPSTLPQLPHPPGLRTIDTAAEPASSSCTFWPFAIAHGLHGGRRLAETDLQRLSDICTSHMAVLFCALEGAAIVPTSHRRRRQAGTCSFDPTPSAALALPAAACIVGACDRLMAQYGHAVLV
ncbi:hypothetical protein K491DRAFT_679394 [Lophiostoma macrostomum CBS 122681]|uniref:Uncharacterized protein n=1 Tax=Lophiostoma macrostomum CBS 122681 TaxID=1314788 RepID=A0A6A6T8E5_9PLEO|nr:hypothetical protein K491DRAFT_679394 [Lophiostoma macrostomum CBS 122681]